MWQELDLHPDVEGFAEWMSHAIAGTSAPPARLGAAAAPRILLGPAAEWLESDGTRHPLGSRRPLRRLLAALADARRDHPGAALSTEQLLRAGWPGENPTADAGSNRVYVAIAALRKLGLGDALQRWESGYRLDPAARIEFKSP